MRESSFRNRIILPASFLIIFALAAVCAHGAVKSASHRPMSVPKANTTQLAMIKAPAFVLPPGAVVASEMNLSQDNILGIIKQAIPAFARGATGAQGEIGEFLNALDLDMLSDAVSGLKAVRVTNFKMDGSMDVSKTFAFMEKQVPESQGWQRIIYTTEIGDLIGVSMHGPQPDGVKANVNPIYAGRGVAAIYSRGKDFLGVFLTKDMKMGVTFGSTGLIDIPKLSTWFGQVIAFKSSARNVIANTVRPPTGPAKAQEYVFTTTVPTPRVPTQSTESNLLKNPSFEEGMTGWTNSTGNPYKIDSAYPNPYDAQDGSNWVGTGYSTGREKDKEGSVANAELRQVVNVTPGVKYALSVWVYTASSPNTCSSFLQWKDGVVTEDDQCDTIASFAGNTPSDGEWRQLKGIVTPTASQITYCLKLSWDVSSRGGGGNFDLAEMRPMPISGFAGKWDTSWGIMELSINGSKVSGTYPHRNGKVTGTISPDGRTITGNWTQDASDNPGNDSGKFLFSLSDDGLSFTGNWGYGDKLDHVWVGTKI